MEMAKIKNLSNSLFCALKDPDWELVMMSGSTSVIEMKANDGDEPFVDWMQRRAKNEELVQPNIKETLVKLTEGKYFTDIAHLMVTLHCSTDNSLIMNTYIN